MTTTQLLPFLAVVGIITITPGPDTALVLRNTLTGGARAGLLTALGCSTGLLVWGTAAALGLAGIGPHETRLEIWADPALDRNTHTIEVEADSARFSMTIQNIPSAENPRTGRLTPLSVIACLRGLAGTFRVGS